METRNVRRTFLSAISRQGTSEREWMDESVTGSGVDHENVFNEEMFWPGSAEDDENKVHIRAAFDAEDYGEIEDHNNIIQEGFHMFEAIFGYRSKSFIAPNFVIHPDLNKTLMRKGFAIYRE